jgi:hypothetical protein
MTKDFGIGGDLNNVLCSAQMKWKVIWFNSTTLQVIQRRDDFGEPRENFNRDWADYKNGFGDPAKEFWMGNENIYMLTNNEDYALRIELEDFEGNKR